MVSSLFAVTALKVSPERVEARVGPVGRPAARTKAEAPKLKVPLRKLRLSRMSSNSGS